jgi:hypothetical protein
MNWQTILIRFQSFQKKQLFVFGFLFLLSIHLCAHKNGIVFFITPRKTYRYHLRYFSQV